MRQTILIFLCFLLIVPVIAQEDKLEAWVCPDNFSGQTLNVYNWSTYIAENTIPDFEEICDVDITYVLFENDDEVLQVVRQGNPSRYDVVVPGGSVLSEMIAANY